MVIRYYATAVLDHLHRSKALAQWAKLGKGGDIPLERALGAFDLFVLHDQHGDLLEVCCKRPIEHVRSLHGVSNRFQICSTIYLRASVWNAPLSTRSHLGRKPLQLFPSSALTI